MNKRNYCLKAAPTATSKEQKSQNSPKAKRIVLGVDVHLRSYQAARKIDNSAIGPVATFRSQAELLLHIENQRNWPRKWRWSTKRAPWVMCCIENWRPRGSDAMSAARTARCSKASGARTTASTPGI